jgi:hypothetical protein
MGRPVLIAAALPGLLTAYLSIESGGYFPGAPALVAAELAVVLAVWLALSRRPLAGAGPALIAAALALAAFCGWVLLSSSWSDSAARATPEYTRALAYLLTLVLFGLLPYSVRRIRLMAYGVAAAIVAICALAFASRTLPDVVTHSAELHPERLGFPLDYWNSLGLLAAIGIVLCGHLACDLAGHRAVRAAGAAAIPLLTGTLYYTFSRGATAAAVVAVAAYVVVGRPRGLLAGALATVPATLVAIMAVHPAGDLTGPDPLAPSAVASGHRVALVVALCVLAAGVFRWLLGPVDTRIRELRLQGRISRRALAATGVAIFLAVLVGSVAVDAPGVAAQKYRDFNSDSEELGNGGPSRLLSGSDNGRREHWHAALESFRADPLHGAGAGMYETSWARHRRTTTSARDGHSLYIESLGETGIVGFALLLICLGTILVAFARRARGLERPLFAALLAAGLGWAVAASVDWVWEMPAVTLWLFALGGAALARAPREDEDGQRAAWRVPRGLSIALRVAAVAVCLLLAVLPARAALSEYHFDRSERRMQVGDCAGAGVEARAALRMQGNRAAPHHVLAFCALRDRHWDEAAREFSLAVERDPHNWALRQGRAVARAAAGLSWRGDARLAVELNPLSEFAATSLRALTHASDTRRTARARSMEVALPELGDR